MSFELNDSERCGSCKRVLPWRQFSLSGLIKKCCRECLSKKQLNWYRKNKEVVRAQAQTQAGRAKKAKYVRERKSCDEEFRLRINQHQRNYRKRLKAKIMDLLNGPSK